jgi:hypothetical protein
VSEELPMVIAAPGMTLAEVAAASTAALELPPKNAERGFMQADGPHRLAIPHPKLGFELPAGLFTLVEARNDVVHTVRSSPHLDYVDRDEAVALARWLEKGLLSLGWERVHPDHDGALEPDLGEGETVAATALGDGWRADLQLRRVHEAGSSSARFLQLEGEGWLVTLVVTVASR